MKLIKRTGKRPNINDYMTYTGIFYCEYCNREVEKDISTGYSNKSCGCLHPQKTHNFNGSKIYRMWDSVIQRCTNKKHKAYKNYGGRGVKICDEWRLDFVKFKDWAYNNGFAEVLEIDRKENDGDYEPSNCRFVTHAQNNRNKRTNKLKWVYVDAIRDLVRHCGTSPKHLADVFDTSVPNIYNVLANRSWKYEKPKDIVLYPGKVQPKRTWNKAYFNFSRVDWQCWIDSFKTFPVSEYQQHVKNIIDQYLPKNISLKYNK